MSDRIQDLTEAPQKVTKDVIPSGFTLSLVIIDAIPVVAFGGSTFLMSQIAQNWFLYLGAALAFLSGLCKVLWKLIVVVKEKNVWPLYIQMRYCMPVAIALIVIGLIVARKVLIPIISVASPFSIVLFAIGIIGMCIMVFLARNINSAYAGHNWIAQTVNGISQICFYISIMLLL